MSADEERRPEPGQKFYIPNEDEGEADVEMEIDEVCEGPDEDGAYNVASQGDFYGIEWDEGNQRWEEVI